MATIFKVNGKNSGKDVSVTITAVDGNGAQVGQWNAAQLGILTHFEVEAPYSNWETKSIINGGQVFHEALPHGATCKLKVVRAGGSGNAGLEDLETLYRTNSLNGIQLSFNVQYQTLNRDQSVNTRALVGCKPHNWNLGAYGPDADVTQGVDFQSTDLIDNT